MLFMVIERFKDRDFTAIGDRFLRNGRMLPEGVVYLASWIDSPNSPCFQIIEASDLESLDPWIAAWNDSVDFEVVPVQTSAEFWATVQP
jgi:hypothetical protein